MTSISLAEARQKVKLGVQFLDQYARKDWTNRLWNVRFTLEVGNMDYCPLAEAFKGERYADGQVLYSAGDVVRAYGSKIEPYAMGFYGKTEEDWEYLRQAWSQALSFELVD
jgi:hypothetical protein